LWITQNDDKHQHIFFDDNIHNIASDSIVAVRRRATSSEAYRALSGEETLSLQARHLVRTPTVEPILNKQWFLQQVTCACCNKSFKDT
jgi:hypothetical protein